MNIIRDFDALPNESRKLCSGHQPRDWQSDPFGAFAAPFNLPLIPKSELRDRIAERKKHGITAADFKRIFRITSLDQGYTNLCWMFAVVMGIHYLQAKTVGRWRRLSPASAAGPLTKFRNWNGRPAGVGGWCSMAVDWIRQHGLNFADAVGGLDQPLGVNDLNPRHHTDGTRADARDNLVLEWIDCPAQGLTFEERAQVQWTLVLNGIPVPVGISRWRHATLCTDIDWIDGELVWRHDNSGLGRDANGETLLAYNLGVYDDAVAPTVMLPNQEIVYPRGAT